MSTPRKTERRRREFKAALAKLGVTLSQWAIAHAVTHTHLNYVLRGERVSPRLEQAIDATIAGKRRVF